jgi:hypothetical protein
VIAYTWSSGQASAAATLKLYGIFAFTLRMHKVQLELLSLVLSESLFTIQYLVTILCLPHSALTAFFVRELGGHPRSITELKDIVYENLSSCEKHY